MGMVVAIAFLLLILLYLSFSIEKRKRSKNSSLSDGLAYKAKSVMTPTELEIFLELRERLNNDFILLAQVRLADFIDIDTTSIKYKSSDWYSAFNKINAKSCDLVVITRSSGEIKACIEINDFTHSAPNRINRDVFLKNVFKKIKTPLFFIDKTNYISILPTELFKV